ncbi:cathepsin B-like cysteine proteinase 5 [Paramacrobiotus metropolitanus]|uniref:cathepsin B-like cysteine proteinase 5 n=1 Tax=Paramacrobiotus metropolitanus TaxID=2943436 RepID=UPI0024462B0C|nr:cathepsin B-like cysteine proteinase 5 [Paramacrobiotus metropolitanus]
MRSAISILGLTVIAATLVAAKIPPPGLKKLSDATLENLPKFEPNIRHRAVKAIPDCFDARTKWPKCKSISDVRDQGMCGTCWAVASAAVLSDRFCIASGEKDQTYISAEHLAGCTDLKRNGYENCQGGNDNANAYRQAAVYGVVSGGNYNSKSGCMPYPLRPLPDSEAIDITCRDQCTNTGFKQSFEKDKHYIDAFWTSYIGSKPLNGIQNTPPDQTAKNVELMKLEIMTNGPITAAIVMYTDFEPWKPEQGAYRGPGPEAQGPIGGHAVRIIGWCKDPNGVPYWLISNSWGAARGDKGYYWVEMGQNVIGIEDMIAAPIMNQPNSCPASLCDKPLDQMIRLRPTEPQSPVYVFQGNCTQEVQISADGKITPVGKPTPIASTFMGGPNSGPIKTWVEAQNPQEVWIANENGRAGVCFDTPRAGKKGCRVGRFNSIDKNAGPMTITASRDKYIYYTDATRARQIFKFPGGGTSGHAIDIADTFSSKFQKVNSLLDIDGSKMLVCGVGIKGLPACATFDYATEKLSNHNTLKKYVTKC